MLDQTLSFPEDPEDLRSFTARLLAEVKASVILTEQLRHQHAGRIGSLLSLHNSYPSPSVMLRCDACSTN